MIIFLSPPDKTIWLPHIFILFLCGSLPDSLTVMKNRLSRRSQVSSKIRHSRKLVLPTATKTCEVSINAQTLRLKLFYTVPGTHSKDNLHQNRYKQIQVLPRLCKGDFCCQMFNFGGPGMGEGVGQITETMARGQSMHLSELMSYF